MRDTIPLKLRKVSDPGLDCIVCRRFHVDAQIQYGTSGGSAAQGIHLRCVGRALAIRGGRRPEPETRTYEDGLRRAAWIAATIAGHPWGFNDNKALEVHKAIRAELEPRPNAARKDR